MEEAEKKMPGTFAAVGRSSHAAQVAMFKSMLMEHHNLKRSAFLRLVSQDMSVDDFEGIERTLEASHEIKINRLPEESDTIYQWLGK